MQLFKISGGQKKCTVHHWHNATKQTKANLPPPPDPQPQPAPRCRYRRPAPASCPCGMTPRTARHSSPRSAGSQQRRGGAGPRAAGSGVGFREFRGLGVQHSGISGVHSHILFMPFCIEFYFTEYYRVGACMTQLGYTPRLKKGSCQLEQPHAVASCA